MTEFCDRPHTDLMSLYGKHNTRKHNTSDTLQAKNVMAAIS